MDEALLITVSNAEAGLCLTPDMAFYASELSHNLSDEVLALHRTQLTATSFDGFTDLISDLYSQHRNTVTDRMVVCAAVANGYTNIRRWWSSAVQTAISIHLNTIGAADENRNYPRIVPHELDHLRIYGPDEINRDLLWRIVTTEPWLSYAERARAQCRRMRAILSKPGMIEKLPAILEALVAKVPKEAVKPDLRQRIARRSIRRAYKLHDRLFGAENLRKLVHNSLVMTGHLYSYSLSINPGDIFHYTRNVAAGTTPIHTVVMRKSDETPLCTLCLYFADTPLIDHLIAFTMHLKNAETELDMLRAGQVQNITSAFYSDPVLPELKGLLDPVRAPANFITNLAAHANTDQRYRPLRDHFLLRPWDDLAIEMMDYPADLLDAMAYGPRYSPWEFIANSERTVPIMERVAQCFR